MEPSIRTRVEALAIGLAAALAMGLAAPIAFAQATDAGTATWPARPVHVLIGGPPGVPSDVALRALAAPLAAELGAPVVAENRPGAISTIALRAVAQARPDGYVLGTLGMPATVAGDLLGKWPVDLQGDFAPVRQLTWVSHVLVARPDGPLEDLPRIVAEARARPSALTFASGGNGTPAHLVMELLRQRLGVELRHVPFNGPAAGVAAVLGGHVDLMLAVAPSVAAHVQAGRLRAVATTAPTRLAALPGVPTLAELGHEALVQREWHGLVAPAGTPPDVVARLARALDQVLAQPAVRERLGQIGMEPAFPSDPAGFGRLVRAETERWSTVVRSAGIRAD